MATVKRYVWRPGADLIHVQLSPAEAETLSVILSRVGGSSTCSPRGSVDSLFEGLKAIGIDHREADADKCVPSGGSIYFNDYPKPFEPGYYRKKHEKAVVTWFNFDPSGDFWEPVTVTAREE